MLGNQKKDIDIKVETEKNDLLYELIKEIEKKKNKTNPIRIIVCVVGGITAVMIMGVLCYRLINTELSVESILSTLLAFFSIFISIFFYFKADEASTKFYKSSYDFMKDISVTLGKIEERFGEKLNSLNDKVSHLENFSVEKSKEIQAQENDKDKIIDELMSKANLTQQEREKYKQEIDEKELQIESLKREQDVALQEAKILQSRLMEIEVSRHRYTVPTGILRLLLKGDKDDLGPAAVNELKRLGYLDEDGQINYGEIRKELARRE